MLLTSQAGTGHTSPFSWSNTRSGAWTIFDRKGVEQKI